MRSVGCVSKMWAYKSTASGDLHRQMTTAMLPGELFSSMFEVYLFFWFQSFNEHALSVILLRCNERTNDRGKQIEHWLIFFFMICILKVKLQNNSQKKTFTHLTLISHPNKPLIAMYYDPIKVKPSFRSMKIVIFPSSIMIPKETVFGRLCQESRVKLKKYHLK